MMTIRVRSSRGTCRVEVPADSNLRVLRDKIADELAVANKTQVQLYRDAKGLEPLRELQKSLDDAKIVHGEMVFVLGRLEDISDELEAQPLQQPLEPETQQDSSMQGTSSTRTATAAESKQSIPPQQNKLEENSRPSRTTAEAAPIEDGVRAPDNVRRMTLFESDMDAEHLSAAPFTQSMLLDAAQSDGSLQWDLHLQAQQAEDEALARRLAYADHLHDSWEDATDFSTPPERVHLMEDDNTDIPFRGGNHALDDGLVQVMRPSAQSQLLPREFATHVSEASSSRHRVPSGTQSRSQVVSDRTTRSATTPSRQTLSTSSVHVPALHRAEGPSSPSMHQQRTQRATNVAGNPATSAVESVSTFGAESTNVYRRENPTESISASTERSVGRYQDKRAQDLSSAQLSSSYHRDPTARSHRSSSSSEAPMDRGGAAVISSRISNERHMGRSSRHSAALDASRTPAVAAADNARMNRELTRNVTRSKSSPRTGARPARPHDQSVSLNERRSGATVEDHRAALRRTPSTDLRRSNASRADSKPEDDDPILKYAIQKSLEDVSITRQDNRWFGAQTAPALNTTAVLKESFTVEDEAVLRAMEENHRTSTSSQSAAPRGNTYRSNAPFESTGSSYRERSTKMPSPRRKIELEGRVHELALEVEKVKSELERRVQELTLQLEQVKRELGAVHSMESAQCRSQEEEDAQLARALQESEAETHRA